MGGGYIGLFVGLFLVTLFLATAGPLVIASIAASLAIGVFPSLILFTSLYENSESNITAKCFNLGLLAGLLLGLTLLTGIGLGALVSGAGGGIAAWLGIITGSNAAAGNPVEALNFEECI